MKLNHLFAGLALTLFSAPAFAAINQVCVMPNQDPRLLIVTVGELVNRPGFQLSFVSNGAFQLAHGRQVGAPTPIGGGQIQRNLSVEVSPLQDFPAIAIGSLVLVERNGQFKATLRLTGQPNPIQLACTAPSPFVPF
jgi:hypothetical protein